MTEDLPLGRWASRRAEYLERTTILSRSAAEALAYSERGFSDAGVARRIEATEGTVTDYLDRAVARFGPSVRHSRLEPAPAVDAALTPVAYDDLGDWPRHYREVWQTAVDRHPEYEPPAVAEADRRAADALADGGQEERRGINE